MGAVPYMALRQLIGYRWLVLAVGSNLGLVLAKILMSALQGFLEDNSSTLQSRCLRVESLDIKLLS